MLLLRCDHRPVDRTVVSLRLSSLSESPPKNYKFQHASLHRGPSCYLRLKPSLCSSLAHKLNVLFHDWLQLLSLIRTYC